MLQTSEENSWIQIQITPKYNKFNPLFQKLFQYPQSSQTDKLTN